MITQEQHKAENEALQIQIEEVTWRIQDLNTTKTRQLSSELAQLVRWVTKEVFPNPWGYSKDQVNESIAMRREEIGELNREVIKLCFKRGTLIQRQLKGSIQFDAQQRLSQRENAQSYRRNLTWCGGCWA